jgi:ArsR family transcriptional regulator
MEKTAQILKTLGHVERLRILSLLSHGELTVSELVQILGLSQPRITQYINSLEAVGIIERLKEGSWVFSRLRRGNTAVSAIVATALTALPADDAILRSDLRRLDDVRRERAKAADAFFASVANDQGQLGNEYLPQDDIETLMKEMAGQGPFKMMVDLGTGTGRILAVFADRVERGSGIDNNVDMLKVARHNLAGKGHDHLTVRQGDLHVTPLEPAIADLVTLHQVLHYLEDPYEAILEASRLLIGGGSLLIVDFETHVQDSFREDYAHRRLGFSDTDIAGWGATAGLSVAQTERIDSTDKSRPHVKIWRLTKQVSTDALAVTG